MDKKESTEDYLESILRCSQEGIVRSMDIVKDLGYSKPSISIAMKKLVASGYIHMSPNGIITLTSKGKAIASETLERHGVLTDFLIKLGVDAQQADQDACRLEHAMSQETFDALKQHVQEMKRTR